MIEVAPPESAATTAAPQTAFAALGLHERLLKGLEALGFSQPVPVQAQSIPLACAGTDLLVNATTGSGKTLAFLLPILQRMVTVASPRSATRALVLVPTRELAHQVHQACESLARFTFVKAGMLVGGENYGNQIRMLRKNPEILIATPGRLLEHMRSQEADLSDLEILVLDEADRMLDMGFSDDVLSIASACQSTRQTLLFSATLTHRGLAPVVSELLTEPQTLMLTPPRQAQEAIRQQVLLADDPEHKYRLLEWLLTHETYRQALVFTNTREQTQTLSNRLRNTTPVRCSALHGDMIQPDRNRVIALLRGEKINVLVATDVAARGLDIPGMDLVINLDMARHGDDYVHRIGRTGRAGQSGLAISLISAHEWNRMISIEHWLGIHFERRKIKTLIGQYQGPKKTRSSGKAAGSKKKKKATKVAHKAKASGTAKKASGTVKKKRPSLPGPRSASRGRSSQRPTMGQDTGFEPPRRIRKPASRPEESA